MIRPALASLLVLSLCACTSEEDEGSTADGTGGSTAAGGSSSAGTGGASSDEWTTLIEGEWTLEAGGEIPELCVKQEVSEDLYIRAIRPVHPPGTHHTLLSQSDGGLGCNASLSANGLIYAAGVGSEGFRMPEGVALKVPAGQVLGLGLHLYNTTGEDLAGRSAMEVVLADPSEVEFEAEAVLVGPFDFSIPAGQRYTYASTCTLPEEEHVFAIFPHMHQLGQHFKATFGLGGVEEVVHDAPYEFDEQFQITFDEPFHFAPGDTMSTECTWQNTTTADVGFGESSDREMCFNIVFQYPARGQAFCGGAGSSASTTLEGPACASPGDVGNELGIGAHCTGADTSCPDGTFCLAQFVSGAASEVCSASCSADADCGTGAVCRGEGARRVCFPESCADAITAVGADGGAG